MTRITAAVSRGNADPLQIEQLDLEDPRPFEVLVAVSHVGICQTDIKAAAGKQGTPKPVVLGHEGVGTVIGRGHSVTSHAIGDRVLLSFASCATCPSCVSGRPAYCYSARALNMNATREDGTTAYINSDVHSHFFGQSSFASHCLVSQHNAVRIPDSVSFEIAGAMGCGVITGAGTVLNVLSISPGSSLVVLGCGGVGLSAIMAARIAGAEQIVAIDPLVSRRSTALAVGATQALDAEAPDLLKNLLEITQGGSDYAIEASGTTRGFEIALGSLGRNGVCAIAGAAGDVEARFRWRDLQLRGLTIRGVIEGDANPPVFVPKLMQFLCEGSFPIDRMTKTYEFADINQAISDALTGVTAKPVLRISHA